MPDHKAAIYRRGEFWLGYDRGRNGEIRSPNLYVWHYDKQKRRTRGTSTGTADIESAKVKLDILYSQAHGASICPACGQPIQNDKPILVADAIANYLLMHGDAAISKQAINARLAHVLDYIAILDDPSVMCDHVDEQWIKRFRAWSLAQPIVSKTKTRMRTPSTTENSLLQLRAAINHAYDHHKIKKRADFKPIPTKRINNSPRWRASISNLGEMLDYAFRQNERGMALQRYLIAAIGTGARPDAIMDLSTDPARRQWDSANQIIYLNPLGRIQTKKTRAIVKAPDVLAEWLDNSEVGLFVRNQKGPVASVKSPWSTMVKELKLPELVGPKLIRRSVSALMRAGGVPKDQADMQLGHRVVSEISETYAPYDPSYIREATAYLNYMFSELSKMVPSILHRNHTGKMGNITVIQGGKRR